MPSISMELLYPTIEKAIALSIAFSMVSHTAPPRRFGFGDYLEQR
ncbi:MAG: hypothetical protein ACRCZS_05085 [Chroococcidiopsis sp.]